MRSRRPIDLDGLGFAVFVGLAIIAGILAVVWVVTK